MPEPAPSPTITLLKSIDQSLRTMVVLMQQKAEAAASTPVATVASDIDLDSKWGDEEIKFDPRDWTGDSCKNKRMSQCPPAFLDIFAETADYFAGEDEALGKLYNGKPTAP